MTALNSRPVQPLDHLQRGEGQQFTAPYGQSGEHAGLFDPGLGDGIAAFVSADPSASPTLTPSCRPPSSESQYRRGQSGCRKPGLVGRPVSASLLGGC